MLRNLSKPAIIAHRGASAYAPENTLSAFELAFHQGADAIELDVKLTADGHVVVIHDQTVDRTTPASGKVKDIDLIEIQKLDAGSYFDIAFRGEKIPTLEEVFHSFGQLIYINIELTNYSSLLDDLPEKVASLVKQYRLTRRILFSSFSLLNLIRIKRLVPEAPIGLLSHHGLKGFLARSRLYQKLDYQSLHIHTLDTTPQLIERIHRKNQKVFIYTVNRENEMLKLFHLGGDGIFTDDPLLAQRTIRDNKITQSNRNP